MFLSAIVHLKVTLLYYITVMKHFICEHCYKSLFFKSYFSVKVLAGYFTVCVCKIFN